MVAASERLLSSGGPNPRRHDPRARRGRTSSRGASDVALPSAVSFEAGGLPGRVGGPDHRVTHSKILVASLMCVSWSRVGYAVGTLIPIELAT